MAGSANVAQLVGYIRAAQAALAPTALDGMDGTPPASNDDIELAERRLGKQLPPSYRQFLQLANGIRVPTSNFGGLREAHRVGWFRDLEAEWYASWRQIAVSTGLNDNGSDIQLMARCLVISEPGDQALLLDPGDVRQESGEWPCYTFSNWAPGAARIGGSFRDGIDYFYKSILANHPELADPRHGLDPTESAYRLLLSGDLGARTLLNNEMNVSWRAHLLAAQFDAFGARRWMPDLSTSIQQLWWGVGGVTQEEAINDPVLFNDLLPLYVVRLIEADLGLEYEISRAPAAIAERMRHMADRAAHDGIHANFDYAPQFSDSAARARGKVRRGDYEGAWQTIVAGLPNWVPMSQNHVAPLGLYYDKELRQLLVSPNDSGFRELVPVRTSSARKLYSERTRLVLETPYQSK